MNLLSNIGGQRALQKPKRARKPTARQPNAVPKNAEATLHRVASESQTPIKPGQTVRPPETTLKQSAKQSHTFKPRQRKETQLAAERAAALNEEHRVAKMAREARELLARREKESSRAAAREILKQAQDSVVSEPPLVELELESVIQPSQHSKPASTRVRQKAGLKHPVKKQEPVLPEPKRRHRPVRPKQLKVVESCLDSSTRELKIAARRQVCAATDVSADVGQVELAILAEQEPERHSHLRALGRCGAEFRR